MSDNMPAPGTFELLDSGARSLSPSGPIEEPPATYGSGSGGNGSEPKLRRYVAAVLRYKWAILLLVLVGTAAGIVVSRFASPEFEAQATIWVETTSRDAERTGPIRPAELLQSSSWIELLRSFIILEPVVLEERLHLSARLPDDNHLLHGLVLDERFAPGAYQLHVHPQTAAYSLERTGSGIIERGAMGDSIGRVIGVRWAPDLSGIREDRVIEFSIAAPRDVARGLADRLQTQFDMNGNFLRLRLRGSDPERTAATLAQITERYVAVAAELKRARLEELVSILEEQVRYAEQNLRESEIALEGFRVQTITLPADRSTPVTPGLEATRDPVFTNFFEMRVELEQLRRSQDAIRRAIDPNADQGLALQTLEAIDAVQRSSELTAAIRELTGMKAEVRALLYRYTPEHPPVRQLMTDINILEQSTIPALATALLSELGTREEQLEQRVSGASTELRQIPPRMIEEARLTRGVAIADNLYTTLQRRFEEARLAAVSSVPDMRILDPAVVPRQPLADPKLPVIFLAFVGSLGLGIAGAILRDRMDPRLRYPEQVTHEMGLTILGAIPSLKTRRGLLSQDDRGQAEEAFRSLRLNVMYAYGTAGPIILTITSPGPGDGKSFVSANLALFFANLGRRTILVDGDIRRGTLHRLLGTDRVPGLTEHLRGTTPEPSIRATAHENLWLLSSGSRMQDGPELLSSRAMRELILRLRGEYDVILVDSPPLGAGVDPFALGTLTGNMLLVLRTGATDRELADAKLELLDRLPIRILGAVLNGVPGTREYRYYSYVSGYAAYDESGHEPALALPGSSAQPG
jgi:polysaccharide biosynthesis transport protein